jgi:hypothetical protein
MFEKEAEERANRLEEKQTLGVYDNDEDLARDEGFNDGEVYGYENGFKDGAEFGYNKANEWYFVKDGDLPKTHGWYWVQYNNDTFDCAIVTKDLRFLNFYTSKDMTEAVYAWKEIVPPDVEEE